jgi:hypothetical protein
MTNPRLVARGIEAHKIAAKLLQPPTFTLVQSSLGPVNIQSGTIMFSKRLVVLASYQVAYIEGDSLYAMGASDFIRDEYFLAMSEGAGRAAWLIPIAKAEMALITGILCPWYLLLGVTAVKTAVFYHLHKAQCDKAFQLAPRVISNLNLIRQKHRTLSNKLASSAARDILVNLPSGVTIEDVAFFVGRCIKGIAGLPEATLAPILLCVGKVALLVTGAHLPSIVAHTASNEARRTLMDLKTKLQEARIITNDQEALQILRDFSADPNTEKTLRELTTDCQQLVPVLETLKGFMRAGQ